jgi:hypothetical protein
MQNILEACDARETVTWLLICNPQITMTHESLDLNQGLLPICAKMVFEKLNQGRNQGMLSGLSIWQRTRHESNLDPCRHWQLITNG